jgi:hypothetical protein
VAALVALTGGSLACEASRQPGAPAVSAPAVGAAAPEAEAPLATAAHPARSAVVPAVPAPESSPAPPSRHFPPAALTPPSARSAEPGDGVWAAYGDRRAGNGQHFLYTTKLHPHPTSRFITLTLVAMDLQAVRLRFMPGVEDVGTLRVPFKPGLIPEAEREMAIAAFNGGFMPRHGRWGMRLGETTIVPPRSDGCEIALFADDSVRIRSLHSDAEKVVALRQTPPCLVEEGALHPLLLKGRDKAWAGHTPGVATRRRSAIGINRERDVLFYAIGVETTARLLAEGLLAAGAHAAAELDINWNWTRFFVFGRNEAGDVRVSASLVDVAHSNRSYVERPSERDFFYVLSTPGLLRTPP